MSVSKTCETKITCVNKFTLVYQGHYKKVMKLALRVLYKNLQFNEYYSSCVAAVVVSNLSQWIFILILKC